MDKENKPEFLDRIYNPEKYPYIENGDGSVSTHRMSAERDEDGTWYVFPTIQMIDGKLIPFEDNFEALESAKANNNYLVMPSKDEAISYAKGGYKEGTPLLEFDPLGTRAKSAKTFKNTLN